MHIFYNAQHVQYADNMMRLGKWSTTNGSFGSVNFRRYNNA